MKTLWQDIRYGMRMLLRSPGFSLVTLTLVAVGVGASTAVFSIFNAFLIRPLPYENPDRLVLLHQCDRKGQITSVSRPNYLDWRQQAGSFETMGYYLMDRRFWKVTDTAEPEEYMTACISGSFFPLLGLKPFLGRLISEEDERPSAVGVVVVSHGFWRRRLGADPQIFEKQVLLDGRVVVGVTPPGFQYPPYEQEPPDLWEPLVAGPGDQWLRDRENRVFRVLGRLKTGVDTQEAQAQMDTIAARLATEYPADNADEPGIRVEALSENMASGKRPTLAVMMGAVASVFLVACVNLAGLLFARGVTRERELAVRSALGAGRWRLLRQMLAENLILAGLGGSLGVLGAAGALKLLMHADMIASMMLPAGFFRLDLRVLGFALLISVLGVPLVALFPSLCCSGLDLARLLASGGRTVLGSRGRNVAYTALVATEVTLTIVLLVAAGLMVRSFLNVITADPGFRPQNVWAMRLYIDESDGSKQRQLLEQLQVIPGVEKAAMAFPPLRGWSYFFCVEGNEAASGDQAPEVEYKIVSPGYFEVMGIRLLQGRFFDERDRIGSSPTVIVDETLAKRFWPDGDAVGKRIQHSRAPDPNSPWLEIVGVVKHIKYQGVEMQSRMQIYKTIFQDVHPNASVVLRTKGEATAFLAPIRGVVRQFDPRPRSLQSLDQMLGGPSVMRRLITSLLAVFAGIALFLSTIGIYAVTRYSVSRRIQEFGIRVALGATRKDVLALVLRRGLAPVLAGAAMGLAGTVATSRVLSSFLFQLSPWDPVTYSAVSLLLAGVALLACYLPARRAARIDPMVALRYE